MMPATQTHASKRPGSPNPSELLPRLTELDGIQGIVTVRVLVAHRTSIAVLSTFPKRCTESGHGFRARPNRPCFAAVRSPHGLPHAQRDRHHASGPAGSGLQLVRPLPKTPAPTALSGCGVTSRVGPAGLCPTARRRSCAADRWLFLSDTSTIEPDRFFDELMLSGDIYRFKTPLVGRIGDHLSLPAPTVCRSVSICTKAMNYLCLRLS